MHVRMSTLIRSGAAASVLAFAAVTPALGARPETGRDVVPPVIEIPAGDTCEFGVRWDTPVVHARTFAWPDEPDGTLHFSFAGDDVHVLTNVESGRSITLRTGGQGDWWIHPDGSVDYETQGHTLVGLYATDIGGPGFYEFRGRLRDGLDTTLTLVEHAFTGTLRDLCAALRG